MRRGFLRAAAIALAAALPAGAAAAAAAAPASAPVTTLDEITIEGEVRLPRVLFITSRDAERPLDFLDLYTPAAVDASEPAPSGPVPILALPAAGAPEGAVDAAATADVVSDDAEPETSPEPTPSTTEEVHP